MIHITFYYPTRAQRNTTVLLPLTDISFFPSNAAIFPTTQKYNIILGSWDENDSFYIRLFGDRVSEHAIVSSSATPEEKKRASQFINCRWPRNYEVNLHAAFLESILRAKNVKNDADVTILVFIPASTNFVGERDRTKIVEVVFKANYLTEGKPVKIFVLDFEGSSDMQLLRSIAVTNGGISASMNGPS